MMDSDIIVYVFEAACGLSAVVRQQLTAVADLQRTRPPLTFDKHPSVRFKSALVSAPHVCNSALFNLYYITYV